jgi:hypothetical protein
MMTPLLDEYLALRRTVGFQLRVQEVHLRNFVKFATERGEAFVRTQSAIDWAALAPSPSQRGHRPDVIRIFARYAKLEDPRHEVPAVGVFSSRRPPYRPFIFTAVSRFKGSCTTLQRCRLQARYGRGPTAHCSRCSRSRGCGSPRHWRCAWRTSRRMGW